MRKYLSFASLTSLTMLTVEIDRSVVPSKGSVRAFVAAPEVLRGGCMVLVRVFADGDDLCPNLGSVAARIDMDSCERIFGVWERDVRARGALGRTVRIGYYADSAKVREGVRRALDAHYDVWKQNRSAELGPQNGV
jgi:hypothetical protein